MPREPLWSAKNRSEAKIPQSLRTVLQASGNSLNVELVRATWQERRLTGLKAELLRRTE